MVVFTLSYGVEDEIILSCSYGTCRLLTLLLVNTSLNLAVYSVILSREMVFIILVGIECIFTIFQSHMQYLIFHIFPPLVQNDHFVDMVYREILSAHFS